MLHKPEKLALSYSIEGAREIDHIPVPKPLPLELLFGDTDLRREAASIAVNYYRTAKAAPADYILAAKKQYSFRTHARLTLPTQIAFELMAREFAVAAHEGWSTMCFSFKFDKTLPNRLYPEKNPSDRHRWKKFDDERIKFIKKLGPAEQNGLSGLTTDLSRFFDSVRRVALMRELERWFPSMTQQINDFGRFMDAMMGTKDGLPSSTQTAFFFGDLLLLDSDRAASSKCDAALRWVDEYWWFDKFPSQVEAAYRETLRAVGSLGLVFNDSKSKRLDRDEELQEAADFKTIRETYYGDLRTVDTSAKCTFVCGLLIERANSEAQVSRIDKFLLNRLRELFAKDHANASAAESVVLRAFTQGFKRSRDSLGHWSEILMLLPSREKVIDIAFDAIKLRKYPLDADRARLLDMMAVPELKGYSEEKIPSTRLEDFVRSNQYCPTLRGSALRALYCRSRDIDLAIGVASSGERNRLLREYVLATAIHGTSGEFAQVLQLLRASQLDEDEGLLIRAYELLGMKEKEKSPLRLLPADPRILTGQLDMAVRRHY